MSRLAKSWCVRNDGSQEFKKVVVNYLNREFRASYDGSNIGGYYGVPKDLKKPNLDSGDRNAFDVLYSLDEFKRMIDHAETYQLTKDSILKMASESKEVEKSLRNAFPDAFEEDLSVNVYLSDGILLDGDWNKIVDVRNNGKYKGKAIYLSSRYDWEIARDEYGMVCVVPTRKNK